MIKKSENEFNRFWMFTVNYINIRKRIELIQDFQDIDIRKRIRLIQDFAMFRILISENELT